MEYVATIGLETHAQLATESKMFCGCSVKFGAPPNTQTCPVCTGLPGTLPVVNELAFKYALKAAVALNCEITPVATFDRKNYYYPDLPKNYQISQNYNNLGTKGHLDLEMHHGTVRVGIWNVHVEEDAGKLEHPEDTGARFTTVDLNRAGTPLLEIVSAPDMHTPEEAAVYMAGLAALLRYIEISDCKMEEGSLRFEAGISVAPKGSDKLGARAEVKNLNSMRAVVRAIEHEIKKQTEMLEKGQKISSQTMLWNDALGITEPMRSKEEAKDYRYFPEPDLVPVRITSEMLDEINKTMPELPAARRRRFIQNYALPEYDAGVIIESKAVADYFEDVVKSGAAPKPAANWVMGEALRELKERKITIGELLVKPQMIASLIKLVESNTISNLAAKEVFAEMAATGKQPEQVVEEKGFKQISDTSALEAAVREVFSKNPDALADLKAGKKQARGFFIGQAMKATQGKANPKILGDIIDKLSAE